MAPVALLCASLGMSEDSVIRHAFCASFCVVVAFGAVLYAALHALSFDEPEAVLASVA